MRRPHSRRQNASAALSGSERIALRHEFAHLQRLEAHFKRTLTKVQEMNRTLEAEKARIEEAKGRIISLATEEEAQRELCVTERERAMTLLKECQEVRKKHEAAGQRYVRRLERFRWNMAVMFGFVQPADVAGERVPASDLGVTGVALGGAAP